jgi:serine/threonine protein kinase
MSDEGVGTKTALSMGRYILYDEIASGGMATVHLGRLLSAGGFKRTVAIKRMHEQYAKDPEFVDMFMDEARLAARVQHPNVVATLDVMQIGNELFQVMEYVHGATLSRLLKALRKSKEPMPLPIVGAVMTRVLYGLHAAHEVCDDDGEPLNVVHRDVSPQNILVGSDGVARVLDFGVAKAAVRVQRTQSGQVKGKLAYMAPEQLAGEAMDRRADLYAAGIVLWEALTGRRMRIADNEGQMYRMVIEGAIVPPSKYNEDLPGDVDLAVLKALSRNTSDRYDTALDLAEAIENALGVASPRDVGKFVRDHVPNLLEPLSQKVKDMESERSTSVRALATMESEEPTRAVGEASLKDATFATSAVHEGRTRRRGLARVGALLAVLAVALLLRDTWRDSAATSDTAPPSPASQEEVAADPTPTPAPKASATTEPSATPASSASATVPAASASAKPVEPVARPTPRPVPQPVKPKPTAEAAAKPNCDPPYRLTESGARRYKLECL